MASSLPPVHANPETLAAALESLEQNNNHLTVHRSPPGDKTGEYAGYFFSSISGRSTPIDPRTLEALMNEAASHSPPLRLTPIFQPVQPGQEIELMPLSMTPRELTEMTGKPTLTAIKISSTETPSYPG